MKDGFYRQTHAAEERHWWFRYRRSLVNSILERENLPAPGGKNRALDLGCGTGRDLRWIERRGYSTTGIDRSLLALRMSRETAGESGVVCADVNRVGETFSPDSFDLVVVFNVLYHEWIRDEVRVLEQVRRVLRPGGYLLLTEPAFEALRRRHDRVCMGARRFTRRRLMSIVEQSGLAVQRATYFNAVSLAPAAAVAALDRVRGTLSADGEIDRTAELSVPPAGINKLMSALCRLESFWLRRVGDLPFGVGILIEARARGESPGPG